MSLIRVTRSELRKYFSTNMWWILAIVLFCYIGFTAAMFAFAFALVDDPSVDMLLGGAPLYELIYPLATSLGYVFPLLAGTMIVTNEWRHHTLTPTFLTTPKRGLVLWGKICAGVVIGLMFAIIGLLSTVLPGALALGIGGLETGLAFNETWHMFARMLLTYVLWVIIGIGVGTLIRNQVAAIVVVLVFTQLVEPILRAVFMINESTSGAGDFLPGGASDVLVSGSSLYVLPSAEPMVWWGGALILTAYAAITVALGYLLSWRRDVD